MTISGSGFDLEPQLPEVRLGGVRATVTHASTASLTIIVPPGLDGGHTPDSRGQRPGRDSVRRGRRADRDRRASGRQPGVRSPRAISTSPSAVRADRKRRSRSTSFVGTAPASRSSSGCPTRRRWPSIRAAGCTCPAVSMAACTSLRRDGSVSTVATDLGVACGIAFNREGELFVGDRSGSILRVSDGQASVFASIPSSVAAFHLAFGPDGLAVRGRANAVAARCRLSRVAGGHRRDLLRGPRPAAGHGLRQRRPPLRRRRGCRIERRFTASASTARQCATACSPAARCSAWRSTRSAALSWRRARTSTGWTLACGAFCRSSRAPPRHRRESSGSDRHAAARSHIGLPRHAGQHCKAVVR